MYEHEPQFIVDQYDEKYDVKGYFVVDTLINGEAESLSPFEVSIDQSRKKIIGYYNDYSSKF